MLTTWWTGKGFVEIGVVLFWGTWLIECELTYEQNLFSDSEERLVCVERERDRDSDREREKKRKKTLVVFYPGSEKRENCNISTNSDCSIRDFFGPSLCCDL